MNLLKFLIDKEQQLREILHEKLILIYSLQKTDKTSQISVKRPRISSKDLAEINEKPQKRRFCEKNITVSLFNDKNTENSCENMEKTAEKSRFSVFSTNYLEKVFDYKVLKQDLDYTSDLSQFLTKIDKKHSFSEEILEKENDFFFANPQKTREISPHQTENFLTKQFISLNKSPLKELEIINKGPYDPGVKSSQLYLKNLHQKVGFFQNLLKKKGFFVD